MAEYLMGIDCGNTSTKAVIFDEKGNEVGIGAVTNTLLENDKAGFIEIDAGSMLKDIKKIIPEAISKAGIDSTEIAGIGVCCINAGIVSLDSNDQPMLPVPLGSDHRTLSICEEYNPTSEPGARWMKKTSGVPCSTFHPLTYLLWYKRNMPDVYAKIEKFGNWKDFLLLRMTGSYVADRQLAAETGLINKADREWDREMFEIMDIEDKFDKIPTLLDPWDQVGNGVCDEFAAETGLKVGTPVIAGLNDFVSCRLGTGAMESSTMTVLAGTHTIDLISMDTPSTTAGIKRDDWLAFTYGGTGAICFEWLANAIATEAKENGKNKFEVLNELIASVKPGSTNVVFLPFFCHLSWIPGSTGGFINLTTETTVAEMAYAVAEGIGFATKTLQTFLQDNTGADIQKINMTGGYSRSDVWRQLMADVLGFPVHYGGGTNETGALGVSILAAWASGIYESLEDAVSSMALSQEVCFNPNPEYIDIIDERYHEWKALVELMKPYWDKKNAGESFKSK